MRRILRAVKLERRSSGYSPPRRLTHMPNCRAASITAPPINDRGNAPQPLPRHRSADRRSPTAVPPIAPIGVTQINSSTINRIPPRRPVSASAAASTRQPTPNSHCCCKISNRHPHQRRHADFQIIRLIAIRHRHRRAPPEQRLVYGFHQSSRARGATIPLSGGTCQRKPAMPAPPRARPAHATRQA